MFDDIVVVTIQTNKHQSNSNRVIVKPVNYFRGLDQNPPNRNIITFFCFIFYIFTI